MVVDFQRTRLRTAVIHCSLFFALFLSQANIGFAVTQYAKDSHGFTTKPSDLRFSINPEVRDQVESVELTPRKLFQRARRSARDPRVEPVTLSVKNDASKLSDLAIDLAKPKRATKLHAYLAGKAVEANRKSGGQEKIKVELDLAALKLIKVKELAKMYKQTHHRVDVLSTHLNKNPAVRNQLFKQVEDFLKPSQKERLHEKVRAGESVSLEDDLLPSFAKRMARKYILYRGPNCFHAALAFHGLSLTRSPWINVKREKGYHKAMINYDELWRALKTKFYEVDPRKSALKFGDLLIFFDVADKGAPPQYKWIRHSAAYLFGPYTFSKGSKSPNTPYTVKTVSEEWKTWNRISKNLGVKVFRRSRSNLGRRTPSDRTDWIY